MRYIFCAFPLVGALTGLMLWGWRALCDWLAFGDILYAAGCVALPVLVTGGIHLDGFLDTVDALSSHAERDKKLAILKDPHIGAFAGIFTGVYMIVGLGLHAQLRGVPLLPLWLSVSFVTSRALAGLFTVALPGARADGLAHTFSSNARRGPAFVSAWVWLAVAFTAALWRGALPALGLVVSLAMAAVGFIHMAKKQFGGMTGDLAGFFIQISELCMLFGLLAAHAVGGWL